MIDWMNTILGGLMAGGVGVGLFFLQRRIEKNAEVAIIVQEIKNYLDYFEAFLKKYNDAVYNFPCRVVLPFQSQKPVRFLSYSQKLQKILLEYNKLVYKICEMKEHLDALRPEDSSVRWLKQTTLGQEVTRNISQIKKDIYGYSPDKIPIRSDTCFK